MAETTEAPQKRPPCEHCKARPSARWTDDGARVCSEECERARLRLIAAAPRMYAVLTILVSKIDRLGAVNTPTMNEARAALALAEGR